MGSEPSRAALGHAKFAHLRVKSPYSLLEGAVRPKELANLCREYRIPAVAVTDTNNLFGVYEIADTLAKARRAADRRRHAVGRVSRSPRRPTTTAQTRAHPSVVLLVQGRGGLRQSLQADLERLSGRRAPATGRT